MKTILSHILLKLSSGRWILTVVSAGVFGYMAVTGSMASDDVKMILGIVITFYFTKSAEKEVEPRQ